MKKPNIDGKSVVTMCVLLFLGFFFVMNLKLVKEPVKQLAEDKISFREFVEAVKDEYTSDEFTEKSRFINLNGLFTRAVGQRESNDVVRLNNGMLCTVVKEKSMKKQANAIAELAECVKEQNIPFLYVQAPYKEDKEDTLFPTGVTSFANENADELMKLLAKKKVKTLDLRPMLSETVEQINRYYFKTDHHWNFEGALVGFREVVKKIAEVFPEDVTDLTYTEPEQWESHTLPDWFLGSRGKRVGVYFGGVDDLTWYTPKFETDLVTSIPKHKKVYEGDFVTANLRQKYSTSKDYFGHNSYCLYIGGDYPLVQHKNNKPVSELKLLLIKDSYSLPLQSYLSTMFAEIDVVDPRHFTECSVAEYAEQTKPDLVLLMMNPSVFWTSGYKEFVAK